MKADEPIAPVVKFGMSTDESERMVKRHIEIMDGQQLLEGGVLDHNLRVADIVHAKLNRARASAASPSELPVPIAHAVEPVTTSPQDWRAKLGLS